MCFANTVLNWLGDNAFAILVSSFVSLMISRFYYYKGNRENAKMSVILPMMRKLEYKEYTRDNYYELYDIGRSYAVRYLDKSERKLLISLVNAYDDASRYNKKYADVDCVMEYYEKKLIENNINPKPCMIIDDNEEIVDYDFPPDYYELREFLLSVVSSCNFMESQESCLEQIKISLKNYTEKNYTTNEILFFDDKKIDSILKDSDVSRRWKERFEKADKMKKDFLALPICKDTKKMILL